MSVDIQLLSRETEPVWDRYVRENRGSIYHDCRWKHLIRKVFGHDGYYLMATAGGSVVGILPLVQLKSRLFGNFMVSMPYFNYGGLIADSDDIARALLASAAEISEEQGCSHIEMRHDRMLNTDLPVRTEKVTMLLTLPDDPGQLWQAIGAKRRAQVKRPIREGVEFITGGAELIDEFYSVFSTNMRDLGTPVYSKRFFGEILTAFPESSSLAVVRLNGEPVGGGFLVGYQGRLEIPWASTLRKYNRFGINMFMYWNILKFAIEQKYRVFDFGRSSKDAGTLKFKKQWGGEERQLYWYYIIEDGGPLPGLNPKNSRYQTAISMWKKMPLGLTRILGPHIVKNLP